MGVPHLEVCYEHWRSKGSKQQEPQLSDGTLRLIGFLFALIDNKGVILLEEPELNLHSGIIVKIPEFIAQVLRQKKLSRQIILTTHSYDMLSDGGVASDEVLLLQNTSEGTTVNCVKDIPTIQPILESGLSMADAVIPITKPQSIESMSSINLF
jgi:predicted ATPase